MTQLYPVGYLCLTDNFCLAVYGSKPALVHRLFMRLFFGWTWKDA